MALAGLRRLREWVDLEKGTLDQALRSAAPMASGNMLDVGCGDKPYQALFAPHVIRHVGVEFGETFEASENAQRSQAEFTYDGRRLPFENASFDTVLCTQVLEHVPEPAALMHEMARVLKPSGRLILTVPFSFRVHSEPFDFQRFTRFALGRMAEESGLEVESLLPRGGVWLVIGQKLCSHLALRWGRLGRSVQAAGGLTYETPIQAKPRWWALPFVAPLILLFSSLARVMDRLDRDESDTLGYILVARAKGQD